MKSRKVRTIYTPEKNINKDTQVHKNMNMWNNEAVKIKMTALTQQITEDFKDNKDKFSEQIRFDPVRSLMKESWI